MKQARLNTFITYLFLLVIAAVSLLPLVYAFFGSFKPLNQLLADGARLLPQDWQFSNYREAWVKANFAKYFTNTIIVTASVVVLDVVFSSMFGYVLARKSNFFMRMIEKTFIATMFLGFGTIALYPKFMLALKLGLLNIGGIIFVEWAGLMVVHILLIKAFSKSLSNEVYEASSIDGSSFFNTYRKIAFPLMRPILSTVAILSFQAAWNNFQVPFVFTLSKPELRTLVVGLYALKDAGDGLNSWHLLMAGTIMSLIPIIGMFAVLQKYFMNGLTAGSVKG